MINCVQKLISSVFPKLYGLQNTLEVPHYIDNTATWRINKHLSKQQPPSAQNKHNGSNNWVMSYQQENNYSVIMLDSLKSNKTLNSDLRGLK